MSNLRFKDDENDLMPADPATFEKLVIDVNFLQDEVVVGHFYKRSVENNQTRWMSSCTNTAKLFANTKRPDSLNWLDL